MIRIWRVYNDMSVKEETQVLSPHGIYEGYGGNWKKWSENNKKQRFGCAQILKENGKDPVILYEGYLNKKRLQPILDQISNGEL